MKALYNEEGRHRRPSSISSTVGSCGVALAHRNAVTASRARRVFQRRGLDELSVHEPFPLTRRYVTPALTFSRSFRARAPRVIPGYSPSTVIASSRRIRLRRPAPAGDSWRGRRGRAPPVPPPAARSSRPRSWRSRRRRRRRSRVGRRRRSRRSLRPRCRRPNRGSHRERQHPGLVLRMETEPGPGHDHAGRTGLLDHARDQPTSVLLGRLVDEPVLGNQRAKEIRAESLTSDRLCLRDVENPVPETPRRRR
jgi:hypothetical protein